MPEVERLTVMQYFRGVIRGFNMEKYYDTFHRTWWVRYNGVKVPGIGKRHYLERHVTYDDAREICHQWNVSHDPGELSDKAEFEEV